MTDIPSIGSPARDAAWVRSEDAPLLPAPRSMTGWRGWVRANLFATPASGLMTILIGSALVWQIWDVLDWAVVRAIWTGNGREACISPAAGANPGACWAFVSAKFQQFIYGFYPFEDRWRVDLMAVVFILTLVPLLVPGMPRKGLSAIAFVVLLPLAGYFLLHGGVAGLEPVETAKWGGLLVTLVVAVTGIVFSLPLGILLALGRRSEMPIVRWFSIAFIEIWRGVPLITVLFMASVMLPLFMPEGLTIDKLLRVLIGTALFSSAYMAENVRGGLQAIPKGQYEAAAALGLSYWRMMLLIILPQALKIVIPGIVNTFISLFKDTTLVIVVGIYDFLGIVQAGFSDQNWVAPETGRTGYFLAALVYWVFCFSMSRYSIFMEKRLRTDYGR